MSLRVCSLLGILSLLGLTLSGTVVFAQDGSPLQVVASYSILADVASNVAGDAAEVTSLMPLATNPHSFTPTPQDLVTLAEADVVLVVGANFEEGLLESIENAADSIQIEPVSSCVEILPFGGSSTDEADHDHEEEHADSEMGALCETHHSELAALHGEAEHDHEAEEHDHAETLGMLYTLACGGHEDAEASGEEHHHDAGSCDPHVWTDPHNVMLWTMMIRDILSELDPANAEIYAANAAAYIEELETLFHDELLPLVETVAVEDRLLVTNHGAYYYFAKAFDFTVVGLVIPSVSDLAEASAAEAAALIDTIRASEVKAVFAETSANPDLAQQIADETGIQFATLYTGSLSDASGPAASYLDYMRYNTQVIVEALNTAE